jgi:hypothetical protein
MASAVFVQNILVVAESAIVEPQALKFRFVFSADAFAMLPLNRML